MKKQIDRRTCDQCKAVTEQSEMMFGGSPFHGWLSIEVVNGSSKLPRPDTGPWDFCSSKCAIAFLQSEKKSEEGLAKQLAQQSAESSRLARQMAKALKGTHD